MKVKTTKTLMLSRPNLVDSIAAVLYSIGAIDDKYDIVDIEFSEMDRPLVNLKVHLNREEEGTYIKNYD